MKKAAKIKVTLKDEAFTLMDEIIRKYGKDEGNNIVIDLTEYDNPITVIDSANFDGGYVVRDIEKIELSKKQGGICLIYGEGKYECVRYGDVMFSDRIFMIGELMSILK